MVSFTNNTCWREKLSFPWRLHLWNLNFESQAMVGDWGGRELVGKVLGSRVKIKLNCSTFEWECIKTIKIKMQTKLDFKKLLIQTEKLLTLNVTITIKSVTFLSFNLVQFCPLPFLRYVYSLHIYFWSHASIDNVKQSSEGLAMKCLN